MTWYFAETKVADLELQLAQQVREAASGAEGLTWAAVPSPGAGLACCWFARDVTGFGKTHFGQNKLVDSILSAGQKKYLVHSFCFPAIKYSIEA